MSLQSKLVTLSGGLSLALLQCAEQPSPKNVEYQQAPTTYASATAPTTSTTEPSVAKEEKETAVAEAPKPEAATPASKPVEAPPNALNDAQIGAITEGANGAEIEQAKLARSKSKNQKVLQFASMMISHHQDAQKKQAKLKLQTAESPLSTQLTEDANKILTSLKDKSGNDFDRAYMNAQVDEHQNLLDALNNRLLPAVANAELKAYLQEVKTRVEQHLEAARNTVSALAAPTTPVVNRPGNAASSVP